MKRRRKTIIAGNLVKIIESTPPLPRDTHQARSAKRRVTTAAQKALNHKSLQGRLEEKLAANFSSRDYFITYTYRPSAEPKNRKEAKKHKAQYIRRLREIRKRRGQPLLWIMALEDKHGDGRFHFHAIINSVGTEADREEIISLWEYGHVHIEQLFDDKHDCGAEFNTWLQLAIYMSKERPEDGPDKTPNGAQIYSCSRNLKRPVVLPSIWADDKDPINIPEGAAVIQEESIVNEYGSFRYIKYMTAPLKPAPSK